MEETGERHWQIATSWALLIWGCMAGYFLLRKIFGSKSFSFSTIFAPDISPKVALIVFFIAAAAYLSCRFQHFCMAGHGWHFENLWPYFVDAVWQAGFVAAIFLAYRSDIQYRYAFIYTVLNGTLFFAVPVSQLTLLMIPLLILCAIFWIACCLDWID